jgi:hypothetical protein
MSHFRSFFLIYTLFLFISYPLEGRPFPISFGIAEDKIVKTIPEKTRDFAFIIPGKTSTYIYTNEEDYYNDYQRSFYAITCKKGGWDCMRHYEILANGCIPYFLDIDKCPENTMHLFPKALVKEAMSLPGVSNGSINHALFDKSRYYAILSKLIAYTKKHLTTKSIAQYLLDTIGYSGEGKILFLCQNDTVDYLKTSILIGLKEITSENIIDFPKMHHIYKSFTGNPKDLYGKGFSYTKIVADIPVDRTNIENRIKNKEFEYIIYSYVHHGCMFYETVKKYYPPEKIVYLDGEDGHRNCKYAHLKNLFLREYDAYSGR